MSRKEKLSRRDMMRRTGRMIFGAGVGATVATVLQIQTTGCERPGLSAPSAAPHQIPGNPPTASFIDASKKAGLDFTQSNAGCGQRYFVEEVMSGAAVFDANGDGFLDIYFPQPKPLARCKAKVKEPLHHRLYINDGKGNFTLKADAFGGVETDAGICAAVGDYNNDGHPDLYVTCYGKNSLFRNRGDATFEDVTEEAGVGLTGFSTGAVWFDYDGDGFLDLFVCRYCEYDIAHDNPCKTPEGLPDVCGPRYYLPSANVLYHNNGDGTFTDVTHKAGIDLERQRSLGVAAADFDMDGRLDLFIANDLGPNFLYHNSGDGTFKNIAMQSGVTYGINGASQANMGVAVGDYDEDGDLDVLVTTFTNQPNTLYRNDGGYFTDVSAEAGIAQPTIAFLGFGAGFFDVRNLGQLDVFFANGHVSPYVGRDNNRFSYKERNQLFLNNGTGKFVETPQALPSADIEVHKGACFGDFTNNGKIDILVTVADGRPVLLRNDSPPANYLLVRLINVHGCVTPIGTRCVAMFEGRKRMRVVLGGGSYGGESDHRVHFGLGNAARVDSLEIHWLSGKTQVLTNIAANQILTVHENR